ncbi:MAG TPA: hypothetical protein VGS11_10620 [Candidatus Bathyarchaeia archaeon]|nr:hypothetical protein [Candidatus Bathyarchaeia archaeon]
MRRRTRALVVGLIIVAVGSFFFAPVVFWFASGSQYPAEISVPSTVWPVYHSLGCYFTGVGDWYAPHWSGFGFGCQTPAVL